MAIERIGLRRLYDALGCQPPPAGELQERFDLGAQTNGSVYIGPAPPMGVLAISSEPYVVPERDSTLLAKADADYKSSCFLEVAVSTEVAVEDSISAGLRNKHQDAQRALLEMAETPESSLRNALDAVTGTVGLKLHRQFVLKLLVEHPFVSSGPEPLSGFCGPGVEVLQAIGLTDSASHALRHYLTVFASRTNDSQRGAGRVFEWLLRAWREADSVAKFLFLFIPLECILDSVEPIGMETKAHLDALRSVVDTSGRADLDALQQFLNRIETKFAPTLASRFESLARQHKVDGWQVDVRAFRQFNRLRNLLLHRGDSGVRSHLSIDTETRTLEDLVERYVSLRVFGDQGVYQSRWRPQRGTTQQQES